MPCNRFRRGAVRHADPDTVAPITGARRIDGELAEGACRRPLIGGTMDDAADIKLPAAIVEEAERGIGHKLGRVEHAAEPPGVLVVAANQTRQGRAALGLAKEGGRARCDAFDRARTAFDLLDVNAGREVCGIGQSPVLCRDCSCGAISVSSSIARAPRGWPNRNL